MKTVRQVKIVKDVKIVKEVKAAIEVKIVKEVKIDKEVKIVKAVERSDSLWRFACGDVFYLAHLFQIFCWFVPFTSIVLLMLMIS